MPASPRIAIASGLAGAAGAALMIAGRLEGSMLTAVALAVVARAAPVAVSPEPPLAARALSRQVALVPAWIAIVVVASLRAGSVGIEDARGANAVAGLAIARGETLMVAAVWLAIVAGALALASPGSGGRLNLVASAQPYRRLEWVGLLLQAGLLLTMFVGPQVTGATDVVPWVAGAVVLGGLAAALGRAAWIERLPAAATLLGAAGVGAALAATPL